MRYYKHKTADQILIVNEVENVAYLSDTPNMRLELKYRINRDSIRDYYRIATDEEIFLDIL